MGAYNVLDRAALAAGTPEDVSKVVENLDAIAAVLNGGIDNFNIAPGAGIAKSKLALANQITDADIAPGAGIAPSKIAAAPLTVTSLFSFVVALTEGGGVGAAGGVINLSASFHAVNSVSGSVSTFNGTNYSGALLFLWNISGVTLNLITGSNIAANTSIVNGAVGFFIYDGFGAKWLRVV
jgi:hypothetical protein